jgi:hypothetical protein
MARRARQTDRHTLVACVYLSTACLAAAQANRNKLDEKMMANVRSAIQDADALLAIVDATDDVEGALAMVQPGDSWDGPPLALVRADAEQTDRQTHGETPWGQACRSPDRQIDGRKGRPPTGGRPLWVSVMAQLRLRVWSVCLWEPP